MTAIDFWPDSLPKPPSLVETPASIRAVFSYFRTPEETAECGMCGHRANITAFWVDGKEGNGSECPKCRFVDDTPPVLDDEEIETERVWMAKHLQRISEIRMEGNPPD